MTKTQRVIELIEKMEQNTFLLPDNWSESINMATRDMSYKTYVGGRGNNRYMCFEILDGKDSISINIRNEDIMITQSLLKKRVTTKKVVNYIEDIYKEQHSFIDNVEGIKKLREEVRKNKESIAKLQNKNKNLEIQIKDALKLRKEI
jgi:hypothetical protein